MARVILILMMLAVCVVLAAIFYALWTNVVNAGGRALSGGPDRTEEGPMAPTGIQKAAYIALIVVLFGVASGWLGGL